MNCVIEQDVPDIYVGSIEKFEYLFLKEKTTVPSYETSWDYCYTYIFDGKI